MFEDLSLEEALLRFRPNIVIRGIPPFSEDHIKFLHIDRAEFEVDFKVSIFVETLNLGSGQMHPLRDDLY